jgi:hypothetical protein
MSSAAFLDASIEPVSPLLAVAEEITFGGGVSLVLVGVYLRWRLWDDLMTTEELAKDRRLSEEQARARIALLRYSGPVVIVIGLLMLAVLMWR